MDGLVDWLFPDSWEESEIEAEFFSVVEDDRDYYSEGFQVVDRFGL